MKNYIKALVEKAEENGILEVAVATDFSVDRDGERIDPNGWDFKNFQKNPVLLFAHDYREAPVGKVLDLRKDGNRVLFKAQFAVDISERAREIFELYKAKFMNAFSVGFIPREWKDEDGKDGKRVRTFTRAELLEISAVPVPANPNAIVMARSAKSFSEDILNQMEKAAKNEEGAIAPKQEAEEESKAVIPFLDLGTMEMDSHWDGQKQVGMCGDDFEKLRKICAWFDSAKPENKESYKLPHHDAETLKANFRGVASAMAVLMGAKGGLDLPENDKKGIYNHLAKHYEQFGKEAPEFKLIEGQVLKNVDLGFEMEAVIQIVKADESEMEEMKNQITMLSAAVKNGIGGTGNEAPASKVDPVDALLASLDTAQLLKTIDKAVGIGLRRLKEATDPNYGKK